MRNSSLLNVASGLALSMAGMLVAAPALAQSAPADAPAGAPDAKAKSNGDEIIVTAERKEQNLQKYGGTSTVLTGQLLKETGVRNIADLQGRIVGLEVLPNNNNYEVWIRGVGSSNNTELGDPAAGTHLDGVYIPRPGGFGSVFFDIDKVEVNVGPQGTLRGRNATAGTVNIIPWHPALNIWDGNVEAGIGNYGDKSIQAAINIPVTKTLAIRLAGAHLEHNSYTHNVGPVTGLRGPEWENNFSGRAQLLWKPSDKFDVLLSYDNTIENGGGVIGTNLAAAEGANSGVTDAEKLDLRQVYLYPTDPHLHTSHQGEKAEINYHGTDLNIQFIASHRRLFQDWLGAPPGLVAYPGGVDQANAGDSTGSIATDWSHYETQNLSDSGTQELRITAPKGSRLEWTLGAFHFTESQASFLGSVASQNAYFQGVEFNTRTKSSSLAGYTDETFHVNSKLSLTGGLRYSEDKKERSGVASRYLMFLGDGHFNCCMGPIVGSPGFQFAGLSRTDFNIPASGAQTDANHQAALDYYLAGIKSFGVYDTVPGIFPNGQLPAGPSGACAPNYNSGLYCAGPGYNWGAPGTDGKYLYAAGLDPSQFFLQDASSTYHFADWRLRAQMEFDPDHMVYGLVATAHKAGGFNDNFGTNGVAPTYDPERVTNFEIGTKNRFTLGGNPVKLNLSGFYESYTNQQLSNLLSIAAAANYYGSATGSQITFPSGFSPGAIIVNYTFNAHRSTIAGAQAEGSINIPSAKLAIHFDALWLPVAKVMDDQEIEDFRFQPDIDVNDAGFRSIRGKRLPHTPEFQMNLRISQKFEFANGASWDYVIAPGYRSANHATLFNGEDYAYTACLAGGTVLSGVLNAGDTPHPVSGCSITQSYRGRLNDRVPGYWTLDIGTGVSLPGGRIRIEGYVNNIVKQPITGLLISQTGGTVAFLPRPTTYGVRGSVRF